MVSFILVDSRRSKGGVWGKGEEGEEEGKGEEERRGKGENQAQE